MEILRHYLTAVIRMSQQASNQAGEYPVQAHPDGAADVVVEPPPAEASVPAEKSEPKENGIPEIVKAACHWAAARGRPAAIFLLAEANLAEDRPDVPILGRRSFSWPMRSPTTSLMTWIWSFSLPEATSTPLTR